MEDKLLPHRAADDMSRTDLPPSSAVSYVWRGWLPKHVFVYF